MYNSYTNIINGIALTISNSIETPQNGCGIFENSESQVLLYFNRAERHQQIDYEIYWLQVQLTLL